MRIVFEDESDLEVLGRAARVLAEIARKHAEGTSMEKIHREEQARYMRFAGRIAAVRSRPTHDPPPKNVTALRR